MKDRYKAILFMSMTAFLISIGQVIWKIGIQDVRMSLFGILTDLHILSGLALYALGALFLLISLRYGEVSATYPIIASSYVWVTLIAFFYLKEPLSIVQGLGIAAIVAGIALINRKGADKVAG